MESKNTSNDADIAINSKKKKTESFEKDVKEKYIRAKAKNVIFFKGKRSLPQFSPFSENNSAENTIENHLNFPKIQKNLFNELGDTFESSSFPSLQDKSYRVNSYLF